MKRTLSAVLAADVVGYSAMMSRDAEAALATLRRLRSEIFRPAVAANHGRLVKSMGDGWIVIFNAVSEAVACAMQVQDRLKVDGNVQLRIGMHLGDVAEEDEDVFGNGVNIASRLESIAEPGALVISGDVRAAMDGALRHAFDCAGKRNLKNIREPVEAWVRGGDVAGSKTALESDELPRLAILPVSTRDTRDDVRELAEAMTGDLATHLNSLRYLTSRAAHQPEAREYQLTPTLRTQGDRLRFDAALIAPDGTQVLSEKFDGNLNNSFDWQDQTSLTLAQRVLDGLISHEVRSFEHLADQDCTADQLLLRMITQFEGSGPGLAKQVDLMALAIEKQPNWGPAYAYAMGACAGAASCGLSRYVAHHRDKLPLWTSKVEELEPPFSNARVIFALDKVVRFGDHEGAINDMHMVLRNLPFDPEALFWGAWVYNYCGKPREALECLRQIEQSVVPRHLESAYLGCRAMVHLQLDEHEEAGRQARRAADMSPKFIGAFLIGASSFALAGDESAAQKLVAKALALSPDYTMDKAGWRPERQYPPGIQKYFEGLRLAGLPE